MKRFACRPALFVIVIAIAFGAMPGCSDEETPTSPPSYDPNAYLEQLPTWQEFCPEQPDAEVIGDTTADIDWAAKTVCQQTECSLTRTPQDIVTYNAGSEILWLGSLIQGDTYLGGIGTIAELPIRERAPLTVSIDLHVPNSSRTVDNPTLATVGDAIHDLVAEADANGHKAGSSIYFNKTTSHSVEQASLDLRMSARYMGATVKAKLSAQMSRELNTVYAFFQQRMFTTSMVLPDRPGDLFSEAFTKEKLDEQVARGRLGPDNPPVYVSNIVWGRMMVLTMTSSMESSRMMGALEASYNGIGGQVSAEHLEVLQQSRIELVTVGGDEESALNFLRTGQLGAFFASGAPLTTAVPISYTLRNLSDNAVAMISETTSYDLMECSALDVAVLRSEPEWRNAVLSAGMDRHQLLTTRANMGLANELPASPVNNGQYQSPWTFEGTNTGFPFDFYLANTFFQGAGALVFNDQEMGCGDCISIGDADDWENDDFEIGVTGTNVYGLAVWIRNNGGASSEDMEIWGATEGGEEFIKQTGGYDGFVGLVSAVPLRRIVYNEDAGGDDIVISDFYFATR